MNNAEKYHFADFTRANYRRLIRLAKERFLFRKYSDFEKQEVFVLWRHDLDTSPHAARKLALIETEEGIRATYFLHLHNIFYNLLEREIVDCVMEIVSYGHDLALHFDPHFYKVNSRHSLEYYLAMEKRILEDIFGVEVRAFSFHNTDPIILSFKEWSYAGMINAYAAFFRDEIAYCSDSNGYWRHRRLEDVLKDDSIRSLQVLTHPEWWQDEEMSPQEKVQRCIDGRAMRNGEKYEQMLAEFGRENLGWE